MDDKAEATLMASGGVDVADIAKELGISKASVYKYLALSKAIVERNTIRDKIVISAYKAGKPIWWIRQNCQVAQGTIYTILHTNNIETNRRRSPLAKGTSTSSPGEPPQPTTPSEEDTAIIELYTTSAPIKAIQHQTGRSLAYIYETLDRYSIPRRRPSRITYLDTPPDPEYHYLTVHSKTKDK